MNYMRSRIIAMVALAFGMHAAGSIGAELRIFAVGSVGPILRELAPEFERTTGNKIEYFASTSGATLKRIQSEQGDVGIISTPMQQELEKTGEIVKGSATVFAKSSAGVAVRKGTALDVSTLDALRNAILRADSIALVDPKRGSTLGTRMQSFADKVGVGDELRKKAKFYSGGLTVGEAVAKGEADFGVGFIPELVAIPNIEVVGALPGEADYTSLATAVILSASRDPAASRKFIEFLQSPAAQAIIQKKGMQGVPAGR
jgi:molybdate transport system substrate-binding protein